MQTNRGISFKLTQIELENLKSQIVISSFEKENTNNSKLIDKKTNV